MNKKSEDKQPCPKKMPRIGADAAKKLRGGFTKKNEDNFSQKRPRTAASFEGDAKYSQRGSDNLEGHEIKENFIESAKRYSFKV